MNIESQRKSTASVDEIRDKWSQQMGDARITWKKLTEAELLKVEGHAQKLAGLIQDRYVVTRDEAVRRVRVFFERHNS